MATVEVPVATLVLAEFRKAKAVPAVVPVLSVEPETLSFKKYDPVVRKHVEFMEGKIK